MTDEALVRCFEAAEEPPCGFHHHEHVRLAWWYLRHHPWPDAFQKFAAGLKRYAAARGAADRYHETITAAYLFLINERLDDSTRLLSWDDFAARHPELLEWAPSILDRYYSPETLQSGRAKQLFLMPDRLAVQGASGDGPARRSNELTASASGT